MAATQYDLVIEQGSDLNVVVQVRNVDDDSVFSLVGWSARMQARRKPRDPTPLLTLTPDVDGPNGQVVIYMSGSDTAAVEWRGAVYDVEITNGSRTLRILQGAIRVSPEITR